MSKFLFVVTSFSHNPFIMTFVPGGNWQIPQEIGILHLRAINLFPANIAHRSRSLSGSVTISLIWAWSCFRPFFEKCKKSCHFVEPSILCEGNATTKCNYYCTCTFLGSKMKISACVYVPSFFWRKLGSPVVSWSGKKIGQVSTQPRKKWHLLIYFSEAFLKHSRSMYECLKQIWHSFSIHWAHTFEAHLEHVWGIS